MAQVKKLQQGGTLNINGKEYTVEQLNDYLSSGQFSSQERAALAGTVRAIEEGKSRYFDANSNSLSGDGNVNEDFAEYFGSENRANRGRSGWSVRKQNRHASNNTDFAIRDSALAKLGNIENYLSSSNNDSKTATNKLGRGSGWFYTDGKYVSGPQNLTNEKHIQDVFTYLSLDDEGRKTWELNGWGDSMEGLTNWYKGQDVNELLNRIRTNQLTDEDKEVLSFMGYTPSESDVQTSQIALDKERYNKAGYNYDDWSNIIEFDDDGNAVLRIGEDGKTAFSSLGGNGNYFFNDSFFANGQNNHLSFLKDHFVIDGKVYKGSDAGIEGSKLYNILRTAGGFYDKNKSGDWEGADQIIKHIWDGRTNYSLGTGNAYSQFLAEHPEYRWTSITGAYDAPLSSGEQLIEFYDPNGQTDAYGYGQAKWAVLDQNGNFLRFIDSRGNRIENAEPIELNGKKIVQTASGNTVYDGLIQEDLTDIDGEYTGTTLFKDPETGEFIYRGRIRGANVDSNKDYVMPKAISDILNKPKYSNFWDNLKNDKQLQRQFERTIGDTLNSGLRDLFTWNTMSKQNWMELGFLEDDAETLVTEFNRLASNSEKGQRSIRRAQRLIDQVALQRNGGSIPKFQPGGAVGTSNTKGHTERRLTTNYQNADDFGSIGDGEYEGMTGADWAELGALVADMGGLALGMSGAPIASGVAGAIGSTAAFGADLSRDSNGDGRGFEWKDVGQYAGNLALDAVSLASFLGSAAQGRKVAKAIKSSGKLISKVFGNPIVVKTLAGMGLGSAVYTSADKIINGEDWTIRDVRNVLNGLSGALTLRKTGVFNGNGTKGKTVQTGEIDVKLKGSDTVENVKLKKDVLDAVNKPNTTDVDVKLKQAIVAELNAKGKKINGRTITVDDIDLTPAKVKTKRTWRHPIKGEATDAYDFNTKTATEPGELLATTGPDATKRGVVDQFNNWLKTGQFVEVRNPKQYRGLTGQQARQLPKDKVWVGQPQEYGDPFNWRLDYDVSGKQTDLSKRILASFRNSYKMPWRMAADQRALLRRASIFTPNLTTGGGNIQQQPPTNFISAPVVVSEKSLSELSSMKKGGVIKAQGGLKFTDWSEETKQRFRDARAAAMAAGKASFDFEGTSYGLKKGADLPKDQNTTVLPEYLTNDIASTNNASNLFRQSQGWQTEYTAPTLPKFVEVTEEVVDEPTLAEQLVLGGSSNKLIRQQQRWQNRAARDAAKMSAGNAVGESTNSYGNVSDLFRVGKLLNAVNADRFQRKMAKNVYNSTMRGMSSNIPEYYNRFQDYGIGEQYRQAADNLRQPNVNVHSDVNAMYADQRARNEQAMKLELEGGLKQSQLYSDWNDQQNELRRTYAAKRNEIENTNRLRAVNAENAYWTQMGASKAQMQNVVDNALTEQLGLYTQDRAMNYQLADQGENLRYTNEANNIRSGYQQKLNNAISAGIVAANTTLDEYLAANPQEYQNYTNQMNALQMQTLGRRMDNYKNYNKQSIFSAKKGGKVSSRQRSASEQIWINNQKITADAVKQLSKQAFEFLKMALS